MKIKQLFRTLTAAALSGVLFLAPALAAPLHGSPELNYVQNGSTLDLEINGLSLGHDVYAAQLSLELGGEYPDVQLTSRQTQVEVRNQVTVSNGTTQLTVYLDAQSPINQGTQMELGTLNLARIDALPQQADLIFLDADLDRTEGTVQVLPPSSGSSGGSSSSTDSNVQTDGHGSVTVSPRQARPGAQVTISTTPDPGYQVASVQVSDRKGASVTVTPAGENRYTFTQPKDAPVSIQVTFQLQDAAGEHPFVDVRPSDWFHTAVSYVYREGLMSGISSDTFGPNLTTTRGMIVTILYRMEGTPDANGPAFRDVPADQYYAKAVSWAAANGIVAGYGEGLFGPNDLITREQMASILYSYANYKGYDTTAQADLSTFADVNQMSSYSAKPMAWANASGLISGMGNQMLSPRGSATRAQVATILMQFCNTVAS